MSELDTTPPTEEAFSWYSFLRRYVIEEAAFITLVVLSLIGITYTDFSLSNSYWYWEAMVPVFGIVCVVTGWSHAQDSNSRWELIRTQMLHWGAFLLAMYLVLMQQILQNTNIGLILLLMLAFSTFLAGVYINWRFCVVGVFLGIAVLVAAFFKQAAILMLLIAIALLVISALWARYVARSHRQTTV